MDPPIICEICCKNRIMGRGLRICWPCRGRIMDEMYRRGDFDFGGSEFGKWSDPDDDEPYKQILIVKGHLVGYRPSSYPW